jgi:hypothetical protein
MKELDQLIEYFRRYDLIVDCESGAIEFVTASDNDKFQCMLREGREIRHLRSCATR